MRKCLYKTALCVCATVAPAVVEQTAPHTTVIPASVLCVRLCVKCNVEIKRSEQLQNLPSPAVVVNCLVAEPRCLSPVVFDYFYSLCDNSQHLNTLCVCACCSVWLLTCRTEFNLCFTFASLLFDVELLRVIKQPTVLSKAQKFISCCRSLCCNFY